MFRPKRHERSLSFIQSRAPRLRITCSLSPSGDRKRLATSLRPLTVSVRSNTTGLRTRPICPARYVSQPWRRASRRSRRISSRPIAAPTRPCTMMSSWRARTLSRLISERSYFVASGSIGSSRSMRGRDPPRKIRPPGDGSFTRTPQLRALRRAEMIAVVMWRTWSRASNTIASVGVTAPETTSASARHTWSRDQAPGWSTWGSNPCAPHRTRSEA